MSSLDQFTEAFAQLKHAWAENRLAHAYLISGSPSGAGLALAQSVLKLLYCERAEKPCGECGSCHRVERRQHPDIGWLEPEKKSRIISVDQIRELNTRLSQTAFTGGWKAGVILACDRLKEEAANAFLKTLEEPPGRTLLLLVTDQVQAILPTLVSRCQKVVLDATEAAPAWMPTLMEIMAQNPGASGFDDMVLAGRLKALLDQVKVGIQEQESSDGGANEDDDEETEKSIRDARVQAKLIRERTELLRSVQYWQRDVLACRSGAGEESLHFRDHADILKRQAAGVPMGQLLARVQGVERVARLLEVNVADLVSLDAYLLSTRRTPARR